MSSQCFTFMKVTIGNLFALSVQFKLKLSKTIKTNMKADSSHCARWSKLGSRSFFLWERATPSQQCKSRSESRRTALHCFPKYRNFCKLTTNKTNLTPIGPNIGPKHSLTFKWFCPVDLSKGILWDFGKQYRPWSDATERGVTVHLQCRILFCKLTSNKNKTDTP